MISIRSSLCIFAAALMAAAVALPAAAYVSYQKGFALDAGVLDADAGKIEAILKNVSADTSSSFNSFDLIIDLGWQVSGVASVERGNAPNLQTTTGYSPDFSVPGHLKITGLAPVKVGESVKVTFFVQRTGDTKSCGDGNWDADVRTGANLGGDTFALANEDTDGLDVQTSLSCGALTCADITTDKFTVRRADSPAAGATVTGERAPTWNKVGACSGTTNYSITNNLTDPLGDGLLHFFASDPHGFGVYKYEYSFPNGESAAVGWLNCDGSGVYNGTDPAKVSGCLITPPLCRQPVSYPAPLGTLAASVGEYDLSIKVNAYSKLPATPFPIVIIDDGGTSSERMRVTKVSGPTLTVERCHGMTCGTPNPDAPYNALPPFPKHTLVSPAQYVMSTPLPTFATATPYNSTSAYTFTTAQTGAGYKPGLQVQVCLTAQPTCSGDYCTAEVVDIGDAWGGSK